MNRERGAAPAPAPADVGIVAALPIEVSDLVEGLTKVWKYQSPALPVPVIEGEHGGKIVAVATGGAGRPAARRAAELLITGHRPRWIISAGFAGALNPAFSRNDLVLADEVIDQHGEQYILDQPPEVLTGSSYKKGRLLTVDRPVLRSHDKADLRRAFSADLVDMESSAVVSTCRERDIRCLSIRVISDEAHVDLPDEIAGLLNIQGSYRMGAVLRAVWHRPSSLKDLWKLYEHALEAAGRLAKFISQCLDALPP
jgi:adenosylhomocysteine nucleosidase